MNKKEFSAIIADKKFLVFGTDTIDSVYEELIQYKETTGYKPDILLFTVSQMMKMMNERVIFLHFSGNHTFAGIPFEVIPDEFLLNKD